MIETLHPIGVYLHRGFLSDSEVEAVAAELRNLPHWDTAGVSVGGTKAVRTNIRKQSAVSDPALFAPKMLALHERLPDMLGRVADRFKGSYSLAFGQYQRSAVGDYFKPHRDPYLVGILYLSDASDGLQGGETVISPRRSNIVLHPPKKAEQIRVAPTKGAVLWFDGRLMHEGAEVTAGEKLTLVGVWKIGEN